MYWIIIVIVLLILYRQKYVEGFDYNKFQLPALPKTVSYPTTGLYTDRHIGPPTPYQTGHVDNILHRTFRPGHQMIQRLKPSATSGLEGCTDITQKECRGKRNIVYRDTQLSCVPKSHQVYDRIRQVQPIVYQNEPYVKNYYDQAYYRDWRYPREPVNLKFLADPKGYCERHP